MVVGALTAKGVALNLFEHIVNPLIALMAFVAILLFIYWSIKLVRNADSVDRKELFTKLAWTIFGIFIIVSVWTIIHFVERVAESDLITNELRS